MGQDQREGQQRGLSWLKSNHLEDRAVAFFTKVKEASALQLQALVVLAPAPP